MADANLTIGATFDTDQLDAAMAEGAAAVKQLPDQFNVAFREVSTVSQRALRQISDDTKAAASTISEQWQGVAAASQRYAAAQREVRAASRLVADGSQDETTSLNLLAAAKQRAADASVKLSAAEKAAGMNATKEAEENEGLIATLGKLRERLYLTSEGVRGSLIDSGSFAGALGAAMGIGLIGEYVNKLKESQMELVLTAQSSGMTIAQLARLKAAFQIAGVDVSNFTELLPRLAEHIVEAREGDKQMAIYFEAMGVSAKSLSSSSLTLDQVLSMMATHLQHDAGNAQDLGAAYALLGRGAGQFVSGLKELNPILEEHKQHLAELVNQTVNTANAAQQLDETEKTLGQTLDTVLLPVLPAVNGLLKVLGTILSGLWDGFKGLFDVLTAALGNVGNALIGIGAATDDLVHGKFAQAAADAKKYLGDMGSNWKDAWRGINEEGSEALANWKRIWGSIASTAPPPTQIPPAIVNKGNPDKAALQQFQEQLDEAQKAGYMKDLQNQLDYWQSKLTQVTKGSSAYLTILNKTTQLSAEISKQELAQHEALLKNRAAADEAAGKLYEESGKGAITQMLADIQKRANSEIQAGQEQQQRAQSDALANIALARQKNDALAQLGVLGNSQKLAADRAFAQQELQIQRQYLDAKLAALRSTDPDYPAQRQKILNQLAALNQKAAQTALQLDMSTLQARKKLYDQMFETLNRAMSQMAQGIIMGTQSVSDAFRRMGADIVASFAETMERNLAQFLEKKLLMRAVDSDDAKTGVTNDAAQSASGAYKATVGIPIIGPVLAPAAAATAFAAVLGFSSLVSSEGGQWRVPFNEQLALLHKNETVLPAQFAEPLRRTVEGGGMGGDVHLTVNATDADSVARLFRDNGRLIGQIVRQQVRLGAIA